MAYTPANVRTFTPIRNNYGIAAKGAVQAIPNLNPTQIIAWNVPTILEDPLNQWDGVLSQYVMGETGIYNGCLWLEFAASAVGSRFVGIFNGALFVVTDLRPTVPAANVSITLGFTIPLLAGQSMSAWVLQDSGAPLNLNFAQLRFSLGSIIY